jgi:hypothetical protein
VASITDLLKDVSREDFIKIGAALQLEPQNHAKNVRLELLAQYAIASPQNTNPPIAYRDLHAFFATSWQEHYMEDPLSSFLTETVNFFSGNYVVYPGMDIHGVMILNQYIEGLLFDQNVLPKEFKILITKASMLLLSLSNRMAQHAGHSRYFYEEAREKGIFIPAEERLNTLKGAVTFAAAEIEEFCKNTNIPITILTEFVLDENTVDPANYDPMENPMLLAPFVKAGNEYILSIPSGIVPALITFIERKAAEIGVGDTVEGLFFDAQYARVKRYCRVMGWRETTILLPTDQVGLGIRESIFRFDNEKLVYLVYLDPSKTSAPDAAQNRGSENRLQKRNEEVIDYLTKLNEVRPHRYLTLTIVGENREIVMAMWHKPTGDNQTLLLPFTDFQTLIFTGKIDGLGLWKFAKAYNIATSKTSFLPLISPIDAYVIYTENEGSFLPPYQAAPDLSVIVPGTSDDFSREVLKHRDEHSVPIHQAGELGHTPVIRHKDYAPIFREREEMRSVRLVIETPEFPIWFTSYQAKDQAQRQTLNDYAEALAFWIYRLLPSLSKYLTQLRPGALEIEFTLDEGFFDSTPFEILSLTDEEVPFKSIVDPHHIRFKIPLEFRHLLILPDNRGERLMMKALLTSVNVLLNQNRVNQVPASEIDSAIEQVMPLGEAKMLLSINTQLNIKLDPRSLIPARYVLDSETSLVLDNLKSYLEPSISIPAKIQSAAEKNTLSIKVASALIGKISAKLKEYNADDLLKWLLPYNEAIIQKVDLQKVHIPAKIACFSDFPTEQKALEKLSGEQTISELAIKCLIEFLAAEPGWGGRWPNIDEFDELVALMNQVIDWGMTADAINFKMDDPEMGLAPSGRIFSISTLLHELLRPYKEARTETSVDEMIKNFPLAFGAVIDQPDANPLATEREIDEGFLAEFSITLTNLKSIIGALVALGLKQEKPSIEVAEETLKAYLVEALNDTPVNTIEIGLDLLSITKRPSLLKSPKGFEKDDIYPWVYNRALSFKRRPLIALIKPADQKKYYYFGFRQLVQSAEYLNGLIQEGRLKAKEGGKLKGLLAVINKKKGKVFRNEAKNWLLKNSPLELTDHEVKIKPGGHLEAPIDLGDVDILAYDRNLHIVYPIECKNTVGANAIHEMKTEMDNYLGRDGEDGKIQKHVRRDAWIKDNKQAVAKLLKLDNDTFEVRSFVLTAKDVPVKYLASGTLPLPMLSFPKLVKRGYQEIEGLFN